MDIQQAAQEIRRMHESQTVHRESIIAWYRFYGHKLPRRYPERSDSDLIQTVALWMELTDRGGSPEFPYDYKSDLNFSTINPAEPARGNRTWLLSVIAIVAGVVTLFFSWKIGLGLIVGGSIVNYLGYKLAGGPSNPQLMKEGSALYEKEGKRVLEWAAAQRRAEPDPPDSPGTTSVRAGA